VSAIAIYQRLPKLLELNSFIRRSLRTSDLTVQMESDHPTKAANETDFYSRSLS
jgi:hypothetical protein